MGSEHEDVVMVNKDCVNIVCFTKADGHLLLLTFLKTYLNNTLFV